MEAVTPTLAEAITLCEQRSASARRSRPAPAQETRSLALGRRGRGEGLERSAWRISSTISRRCEAGRIDGKAEPDITRPALAIYLVGRQGRRGASRLRPHDRRSRQGGQLFGVAHVFAEERLYLRRARLFHRPARREGTGGDRRDQRSGGACRFRLDQAGLLHQPAVLRRARRRRAAAGHRPVIERHRLRQHPQGGRGRARQFPKAGRSMPRASRPPIRPRP